MLVLQVFYQLATQHLSTMSEWSEDPPIIQIGGGRFTTAMVYLSHLASGGFTVFPKLGLFFEPRAGDLLFWNLKRTDGSTDERLF